MRRFRVSDLLFLTFAFAIGIVSCNIFHPGYYQSGNRFEILFFVRTMAMVFTYAITVLILTDAEPLATSLRTPGKLTAVLISFLSVFALLTKWQFLFAYDRPFLERLTSFAFNALMDSDVFMPAYSALAAFATLRLLRLNVQCYDWMEIFGKSIAMFWLLCALFYNSLYHRSAALYDYLLKEYYGGP
jgi:hypothetical protein